MKKLLIILFVLGIVSCKSNDNENQNESNYFPPLNSNLWETQSASDLQWNTANEQDLFNYLEGKETKGFIILVNGKIVIEKYFHGHSKNLKWNWNSAGKTLTGLAIGIAQQEGLLNINDKTSDYLETHWTSLTLEKENLITIKHQLTMTTGLNDANFSSTNPSDLTYLADAGTRWAYHNGPYTLLQDVIAQSTNQSFENYFSSKLESKIGMNGVWFNFGNFHIYKSTTRDMSRFGLLILNKGLWNGNRLIDATYYNEMINTSQNINKSYGYLWWLNGKDNFMLPQSQQVFNTSMIPNAPNDMIMALGANDQKIYVVPSKNMVVIRMGDAAGDETYSLSSFDNTLWEKINAVIN